MHECVCIANFDNKDCVFQGVRNIAAVSLGIGYPTAASAPHSIVNGFKKLLALAVETDINFAEAEMVNYPILSWRE